MYCEGQIIEWRETQGFGFIAVEGMPQKVFLHLSGMKTGQAKPRLGSILRFDLIHREDDQRPRAILAEVIGFRKVESTTSGVATPRVDRMAIAWTAGSVEAEVKKWFPEKGYGFATSEKGDIFVHQSACLPSQRAPAVGDRLHCEYQKDESGRLKAQQVRILGEAMAALATPTKKAIAHAFHAEREVRKPAMPPRAKNDAASTPIVIFSIIAFTFLIALGLLKWVPMYMVLLATTASFAAFFAYFFDKWAAINQKRRVREFTLNALALAGGWPGALFAQEMLRHKTQKQAFRSDFWMATFFHIATFSTVAWFNP